MRDEVIAGCRQPVHFILHPSSFILSCCWFALFCQPFVGCRPALEVSDQARPTALLDRDPAEDGVDAGRWPQWRGRNGSGIASAGSPAIHFSDTQGYRWKTPLAGSGNSSPVVWDDAVLLTAEFADADMPSLAVLCFDRRDGRLLWRADAGKARGRTHAKNGYASASVTTDGQRIFAFVRLLGAVLLRFRGQAAVAGRLRPDGPHVGSRPPARCCSAKP